LANELVLVVDEALRAIGQAMASQIDRQQVLNRLVEAAVLITDADDGSIFLKDPALNVIRVRSRLSAGQQHARAVNQVVQDQMMLRAMASGSPQVFPAQDAQTAGSAQIALIDVPLNVRNRSIAVLRVARLGKDPPFSQDDLHALSTLASYGAIALENIYLRAEIETEVERTAISQIGATFSSTLRLDLVLEMVVDVAVRIVDAERGYLVLLGEQTQVPVRRVAHGLTTETLDAPEFRFARRIVHRVIQGGKPVLTVVERTRQQDGASMEPRAVVCVPIVGASGTIGAIYVDHHGPEGKFTEYHRSTLAALSVHAAAAIENARLFNRVKAEQDKLEAVIRGTEQPVIVTDVENQVLLMNSAAHRAFGTGRTRGTGMLLSQVITHPSLSAYLDQARISGQIQHGEISDGKDRAFSVTVTPIAGVGLVTVMQDVTSIKELSELKSEFVAAVSHDLRSPLSTVYSLLDAIEQFGPLTEEQRGFVTDAQQEVTRLLDLTGGLLDLARLEAEIELPMHPCDLGDVVARSADIWRDQAEQKGLVLVVELPTSDAWVRGNAGRLWQMVDNLLNNALKYTPPPGQISVRLAQEGGEVVLRVADSGIGIAPQDQPYVFDRFYRVRDEHTQGIEGTGLGLAIVKSIVERHGGRIWLESELGQGSMVGVALPSLAREP
jgi:PAS domain S-box-containing protein